MAKLNRYVHAESTKTAGNGVTLVARPARLVCGGADDSHYELVGSSMEEIMLAPFTRITVLENDGPGIGQRSVAVDQFPSALAHDQLGSWFQVVATDSGVIQLVQQFHP